jgi:hypothetical protein
LSARATLAFIVLSSSVAAASGASRPPTGKVVPVFSIAKSQNKNQVQYVVRVDDQCKPTSPAPLSAYWRMLELGPTQTEPLLSREQRAYGLASQVFVAGDRNGGQVRAVLNALPDRPVIVVTSRGRDGACQALATLTIAGVPAHLFNVYVQLKWDGVDYLLLRGWSMDGSHVVQEKLKQ